MYLCVYNLPHNEHTSFWSWECVHKESYFTINIIHILLMVLDFICSCRCIVVVEEENEMDGSDLLGNQFDKLSSLQKHLIRHRELFLSRQVETYKIDMVR